MQNVLITGAGRPQALGFNLVKRYLEHGDRVFACVRKSTDSFTELLRMEGAPWKHIVRFALPVLLPCG
jgi:NAD(P)-dependent dehydrogenase (short-subunit alcohol dehydrogenase family)